MQPQTKTISLLALLRVVSEWGFFTHQKDNKMNIPAIAAICHEANRQYCQEIGDHTQVRWSDSPGWQRQSAINGVQFRLDNPDSTPKDSHDNWLREKRADGWEYGLVKDTESKIHPCMVEYDKLPPYQRAKDSMFIAIVDAVAPAFI